jgi:uncharacterized protein YqgV (UPF0045/DUF77 family)
MAKPKKGIQNITQLGDQLSEAIAKIGPNLIQLQDATNHIESLKTLPETTQEQIISCIQAASQKCAETLVKDMTSKIDKRIQDIIQPLDFSAQYALCALQGGKLRKWMKVAGFICLSIIIASLIGFGGGYHFGSQRISLPIGVKVHSYPTTSTHQQLPQKPQRVNRGAKKKDVSEKK